MTTELDNLIERTVDMMRGYARDALLADEDVLPQHGVLCTQHPVDGTSFGKRMGLIIVIPTGIAAENEAAKDYVAVMIRALALTGRARAVVSTYDAWVVEEKKRGVRYRGPVRDDENRRQALISTIEREGCDRSTMIRLLYTRDQGQEELRDDNVKTHGRLAGFLKPPIPGAVEAARVFLQHAKPDFRIEML